VKSVRENKLLCRSQITQILTDSAIIVQIDPITPLLVFQPCLN